jgi:hypothetical protein
VSSGDAHDLVHGGCGSGDFPLNQLRDLVGEDCGDPPAASTRCIRKRDEAETSSYAMQTADHSIDGAADSHHVCSPLCIRCEEVR